MLSQFNLVESRKPSPFSSDSSSHSHQQHLFLLNYFLLREGYCKIHLIVAKLLVLQLECFVSFQSIYPTNCYFIVSWNIRYTSKKQLLRQQYFLQLDDKRKLNVYLYCFDLR